jgi:hypothetical protein
MYYETGYGRLATGLVTRKLTELETEQNFISYVLDKTNENTVRPVQRFASPADGLVTRPAETLDVKY